MFPHYERNKSYILLTRLNIPIFHWLKTYLCIRLIRKHGETHGIFVKPIKMDLL